jgi:hypothetical protein
LGPVFKYNHEASRTPLGSVFKHNHEVSGTILGPVFKHNNKVLGTLLCPVLNIIPNYPGHYWVLFLKINTKFSGQYCVLFFSKNTVNTYCSVSCIPYSASLDPRVWLYLSGAKEDGVPIPSSTCNDFIYKIKKRAKCRN